VVAYEYGLFKEYGLDVEIESQASWKHVHDKIIHGQLHAAHAPAMMPFLISLGLTPEHCECVTGLVLSLQGNAITVSRELWRLGVRNAASLRQQLWEDRHRKVYTFGVSYPLAAQYSMLCQWLRSPEVPPFIDVRIESVPAEQLFPLLKLGYLDGYCAGEPWTSVAVQAGIGACITTSATLAPLHPEKVLLTRKDFANERREDHERLIAALIHACFLCEQPENRTLICDLLAQSQYVNAPSECLQPGLVGPFSVQDSAECFPEGLHIFYRGEATRPTTAKSSWIINRLFQLLRWTTRPPGLKEIFRLDIYRHALRLVSDDVRKESPIAETSERRIHAAGTL
jgi:ABC-type nitrate/sulfonate/bicarbonate transport system substrate-binding protein